MHREEKRWNGESRKGSAWLSVLPIPHSLSFLLCASSVSLCLCGLSFFPFTFPRVPLEFEGREQRHGRRRAHMRIALLALFGFAALASTTASGQPWAEKMFKDK